MNGDEVGAGNIPMGVLEDKRRLILVVEPLLEDEDYFVSGLLGETWNCEFVCHSFSFMSISMIPVEILVEKTVISKRVAGDS
jgi:hypothetical protein